MSKNNLLEQSRIITMNLLFKYPKTVNYNTLGAIYESVDILLSNF